MLIHASVYRQSKGLNPICVLRQQKEIMFLFLFVVPVYPPLEKSIQMNMFTIDTFQAVEAQLRLKGQKG